MSDELASQQADSIKSSSIEFLSFLQTPLSLGKQSIRPYHLSQTSSQLAKHP